MPKQDSARSVVNFEWVLTHHVQANHTIDANRDGLGEEGQIFDHHAEIVSLDRAKLQAWDGRQSGLHPSVDTCQDARHFLQMKFLRHPPVENGGVCPGIQKEVQVLLGADRTSGNNQVVAIEIEPERLGIRIASSEWFNGQCQKHEKGQ